MDTFIEQEISHMGHLQSSATVIIAYVRAVSKGSEFRRTSREWTLIPNSWINLRFAHRNVRNKIIISLRIPSDVLEGLVGTKTIKISNGRFPQSSRITMDNVTQIAATLRCIECAYQTEKAKLDHIAKTSSPKANSSN